MMITRCVLSLFLFVSGIGSQCRAGETGQLVGQLADVHGQITYVGEVVVFLGDAKTGLPIHRETRQPVQVSFEALPLDKLWYSITDESGSFEFKDVPVGQYRLVAQSWSGTRGLPKLTGKTSTLVMLHGVAENISVKLGERTVAYPKQLGNGCLRIMNDPPEGNAFLLISLKPTVGDAILGPYGWGNEFVNQLIGVTHMERSHVTIFGLPDKHDVHVALMNYDNNPGSGTGTFQAGQREGRLRIVASWSNGHKDPPQGLLELTDFLAAKKLKMGDFLPELAQLKDRNEARQKWMRAIVEDPNRQIEVPGLRKHRIVDIAAALAYVDLRNSNKK